MSDLIERLRAHPWAAYDGLRREAADEIERLTAENERLRAGLKLIAEIYPPSGSGGFARETLEQNDGR